MIDKEYLDQLKEEDYIAWAELVDDPLVTGGAADDDLILPVIVLFLLVIALIVFITISF